MVKISIISALFFALSVTALTPNNAGASAVGNGQGKQFTTGGCVSDADCQQGCCAGGATSITGRAAGICSGIGAEFQNGKTGCGFQDPNAQQNIADAKAQAKKQGFKRVVREE
ncbi:biotrophy-associated secreted protein 2 [Microdochium trichocladiopsis]|uniref:Biotrophy-associated secreted protein 2 n=1 Tax=Microdochium trichocladiopsis TaxID=1682393 RepID=A0A9P8XU82_9PEZI|nr:biotrophy-associated secreted protein 2 [Microdochium trichocladiopsis]KAH7018011.1 biotrophy-associated secreted protein 2 [Microdochium trichocladiopsis]